MSRSVIKLTDVVRRYSGDEDVVAWLDRLELVCELQKTGESSLDMAIIIPMFLEGPAYDVYAQMNEAERTDACKLKKALKVAFGMSPSLAYAKFKARFLREGESPDAFLAELRRLGRTICASASNDAVDEFVVCQFVDGLPEPTRSQLRALKSGSDWKVSSVLQCAKSILQQRDVDSMGGLLGHVSLAQGQSQTVGTTPGAARKNGEVRRQSVIEGSGRDKLRCEGCGRRNHTKSECRVRCFACNQMGHLRKDCTVVVQGNGDRGAV